MARRAQILVVLLAVATASFASATPSGAVDPAEFRLCGTKPGETTGIYSFTKAYGISCKGAQLVAAVALERFCERESRCTVSPSGGTRRGTVRFKRWECKVRLAYEFARLRCEHPDRFFIQESGA